MRVRLTTPDELEQGDIRWFRFTVPDKRDPNIVRSTIRIHVIEQFEAEPGPVPADELARGPPGKAPGLTVDHATSRGAEDQLTPE